MMEDAERLAEQIVTLKSDNKRLAEQVAALTAERDGWREDAEISKASLDMLKEKSDYWQGRAESWERDATTLGFALAAAQARLKELSSVLEGVEIPFNLHEKIRYLLRETP